MVFNAQTFDGSRGRCLNTRPYLFFLFIVFKTEDYNQGLCFFFD